MHETFVRLLGEEEREAFYEEMKVVAQLFGTRSPSSPAASATSRRTSGSGSKAARSS